MAKGTWYGDDLIRSLASEQAARQRRRMWGVALVVGLLGVWTPSHMRLGEAVAAIAVAGVFVDTAIESHNEPVTHQRGPHTTQRVYAGRIIQAEPTAASYRNRRRWQPR